MCRALCKLLPIFSFRSYIVTVDRNVEREKDRQSESERENGNFITITGHMGDEKSEPPAETISRVMTTADEK